MAKNFKELQAKMSPERRARNQAAARQMIAEMALDELREARELTQENLARKLRVKQASISKMERRTDMYLSTLRSYIEAMGGELEIVARFSDGVVRLSQFAELDRQAVELDAQPLPERHVPNVAIWTSASAQAPVVARIWHQSERSITTRSNTPTSNTPGYREVAA